MRLAPNYTTLDLLGTLLCDVTGYNSMAIGKFGENHIRCVYGLILCNYPLVATEIMGVDLDIWVEVTIWRDGQDHFTMQTDSAFGRGEKHFNNYHTLPLVVHK